jgi:hypothetical protein
MNERRTAAKIMRDRGCSAIEAEATLAREAAEDGEETTVTVSVNGGPEVPIGVAMAALDVVTKKDKTLTRKETKNLPCKLTEAEVLAYGRDLAGKHAEYSRIEGEFTALKTEFKGKLEEVDARISTLASRVQSGQEYRDVETIETKNWTKLTVSSIRTDTGEVIQNRPMREDEKQAELFDDAAVEVAVAGEEDNTNE